MNGVLTPTSFYVDVANSVEKFVDAAFCTTRPKANRMVGMTMRTDLFVDSDTP